VTRLINDDETCDISHVHRASQQQQKQKKKKKRRTCLKQHVALVDKDLLLLISSFFFLLIYLDPLKGQLQDDNMIGARCGFEPWMMRMMAPEKDIVLAHAIEKLKEERQKKRDR
jgi:hypothetical protein